MIKKGLYKFLTLFMLILYIGASTGLSFYIHFCSCEDKTFTTVFTEHKCHVTIPKSCCDVLDNTLKYSDNACGCKSLHITVRVDENYDSSVYTFSTINYSLQLNVNQPILRLNSTTQRIVSNSSLYVPDDSPPVKPVGRSLINVLHQSKTPDSLS